MGGNQKIWAPSGKHGIFHSNIEKNVCGGFIIRLQILILFQLFSIREKMIPDHIELRIGDLVLFKNKPTKVTALPVKDCIYDDGIILLDMDG